MVFLFRPRAEPDRYVMSFDIDVFHDGDLMVAFCEIGLVDADLIHPNELDIDFRGVKKECWQCGVQIIRYCKVMAIDDNVLCSDGIAPRV